MPERQPSNPGTLLGVAPPQAENDPNAGAHSPVFVRSGTSPAGTPPPPIRSAGVPPFSAPRPPVPVAPPPVFSEPPPVFTSESADPAERGAKQRLLGLARRYPVLWMALAPATLGLLAIGIATATAPAPKPRSAATTATAEMRAGETAAPAVPATEPLAAKSAAPSVADLEGKPTDSLNASELLRLAEARAARRQEDGHALCSKLTANPSLLGDKANQAELLRLIADPLTSREALGTLAKFDSPLAADLLYEVWTGTPSRNEATDLARQLVYSKDVRQKASPALAVALELRAAEKCEDYEPALPRALKDGDRRSLHLLTKLAIKRGCGPKKNEDCYACLRDDDLPATINAVKARRPPSYPSP